MVLARGGAVEELLDDGDVPEVAGLAELVLDVDAGGLDAEAAAEVGVWGADAADVDGPAEGAGEGAALSFD